MNFAQIFLNELDWTAAFEIAMRTLIMFAVIMVFLRLSGKRGIRQLSLFEVSIVIGLGSAAGDPMFNSQNAIVPALIVFLTVLLFYRSVTLLASKSALFETAVEGNPQYVIDEGIFVLHGNKTGYARDEFFSEMRQQSIEHVGQVKTAILETNGVVSFFYYPDEEVKSGLPVLPKVFNEKSELVSRAGKYACVNCAQTQHLIEGFHSCPRCKEKEWVQALCMPRIT